MSAARPRLLPALGGTAVPLLALGIVARFAHSRLGSTVTAVLMVGCVAALAVDVVWGMVAVRRAGVRILVAPTDGVVGEPATAEVEVTGVRGRVTLAMTTGDGCPWVTAGAGDRGVLHAAPTVRGVALGAGFEVRGAGPFGLAGGRRVLPFEPLPHPLVIAPRLRRWDAALRRVPPPQAAGDDEVRAVRPYVAGDDRRLVHWPSSARTGSLVVRELESNLAPVTVCVDLGDGADHAKVDAFAGGASWVVTELVRAGRPVRLVTMEDGAVVEGVVTTPLEVGRRFATAGPGRLPPRPTDLLLRLP